MKAAYYEAFRRPIQLVDLPDPAPPPDGVVVRVMATGLCRSDWHGWMGHDADVKPPHVPGHELAGVVEAAGKEVKNWKAGDRITVPFCLGCGRCPQCRAGHQQVCDHYYQPGFTGWGSFAEYVALPHADVNLVQLPDALSFVEAAILGCRFTTSYRAIVAQGRVQPGDWVAIHGCGGVGLSAIMIARAAGARVLAVDIDDDKLAFAKKTGAEHLLNARKIEDIPTAIRDFTRGGAHISLDALGSTATCVNSILSLRKRGRHLQVGLMAGEHRLPPIPFGPVIANELEILGSHGMQAHAFPGMMRLITSGKLQPKQLLGKTITLEQAPQELQRMGDFPNTGVTVIDRF
jgi:alcohol dehydrogenase